MICPKCGAKQMDWDKPIYFNKDNREGDFLYREETYHCRICGKVVFVNENVRITPKRFVKGQVITTGYENL